MYVEGGGREGEGRGEEERGGREGEGRGALIPRALRRDAHRTHRLANYQEKDMQMDTVVQADQ